MMWKLCPFPHERRADRKFKVQRNFFMNSLFVSEMYMTQSAVNKVDMLRLIYLFIN